MHRDFYDWLRTLTADGDISSFPSTQWWEAVEKFAEVATAEDFVGLTLLAYERPTQEFDAKFREHLRGHEESSPLRGLERQVAVLAAATILQIGVTRTSYLSEYLRLCAAHVGWVPVLDDLGISRSDLESYGTGQRELPAWPTVKATLTTTEAKKQLPEDAGGVTNEVLRSVLDSFGKSVVASVDRNSAAVIRAAKGREAPLLEQAEILAWLLAGRSMVLGLPWKKLSTSVAAVCAAIELEDVSSFATGRPDASAILSFAADAAGKRSDADLAPVAATLRNRRESLGTEQWSLVEPLVPVVGALIDGDWPGGDPVEGGLQLHDELFLLRAYAKLIEAE